MAVPKGKASFMLTTTDNPFDPFDQWKEWFAFDTTKGYNSCALLDRLTVSSESLSEEDQLAALSDAIEDIITNDPIGRYKYCWKEQTEEEKETL